MPNYNGNDRLDSLIKRVSGSMRFLSGRSLAITSVPMPAAFARPEIGQEASQVGGTVSLDDERQIRAFAKDIKRLIAEDSRRGIRF